MLFHEQREQHQSSRFLQELKHTPEERPDTAQTSKTRIETPKDFADFIECATVAYRHAARFLSSIDILHHVPFKRDPWSCNIRAGEV